MIEGKIGSCRWVMTTVFHPFSRTRDAVKRRFDDLCWTLGDSVVLWVAIVVGLVTFADQVRRLFFP